MKIKGAEITQTMAKWGYFFVLSAVMLTGMIICTIATLLGLNLIPVLLLLTPLFALSMKIMLDTDKQIQEEFKERKDENKV